MVEIWIFISALALGCLAGWAWARRGRERENQRWRDDLEAGRTRINELDRERAVARTRGEDAEKRIREHQDELARTRETMAEMGRTLATEKQKVADLERRLDEERKQMEAWSERFRNEFKVISTEILKENSKRFTEQNQEQLGTLLEPLKERIVDFRRSVSEIYEKGLKEHTELKASVAQIRDLNQVMSEEARNLTLALKGENKVQGDWGEVILERLLELSGLERGREYEMQESFRDPETGQSFRPDVLIHLPEERNLIIDAKVTLVAYERYCSAQSEEERALALKEHIAALRGHVRNLADKDYAERSGRAAPDFTFLFVPVEPAFNLALREDGKLFEDAFSRKIVMVTPSTLLASLKTVASLWRQEKQNRNAEEIARLGGQLHDKLANFCDSLEEIGSRLQQATAAYDQAKSRLSEGRGNLLRTADKLRNLGARTSKVLPSEANGDEEEVTDAVDPEDSA